MSNRRRNRRPSSGGRTTPAKRSPAEEPAIVDDIPAVRAVLTVTTEHYGPLPPPDMLADYERVLRRSAERIIRMAERPLEMGEAQMRHRHQLETTVIRSDIRRSWAGLAVAALLSLVVLGGGIYLAYRGRQAAGLGSVLAGAAALAAVFFKAKSSRDNMTQPEPANPRRR